MLCLTYVEEKFRDADHDSVGSDDTCASSAHMHTLTYPRLPHLPLHTHSTHAHTPHLTSPHPLTSPHLTSPHFTSPHLTSPLTSIPHPGIASVLPPGATSSQHEANGTLIY